MCLRGPGAGGARAVAWYRTQLESEPGKERWLAGLSDALMQAERWDEAYDVCQTLVEKSPLNADHRGEPGCLAARRSRRDEAMRISEELRQMNGPCLFGAHTYRRACIAALRGDKASAVERLREAFAQGRAYGTRHHREIDLEPLWGYAPFQDLLRPKG